MLTELHSEGEVLSPQKLCHSGWKSFASWCDVEEGFNFQMYHRIHPLYVSQYHKHLVSDVDSLTLALPIDFRR